MPIPKAALFDNDGLLLDTESVWSRAEQTLFERRERTFTISDPFLFENASRDAMSVASTILRDGGTVDLALLLLDRPPPVTPRPWTWWGPAPAIGSRVRHVGYGRTESTAPGVRSSVVTDVTGATEARAHGSIA